MMKNQTPLDPDEEYVSYDADSLFISITAEETIEYIIYQIYNEKKVPKICSKTIFRRLMYKLATECAVQFNQNLFKQTEGCSLGGPLSVTLADMQMIRTEKDITPLKPIFYKIFVDDIYITEGRKIFMIIYMKDLINIIQTLSR